MLLNTVWRQYNKENNFRELLARFCKMEIESLIVDDKVLYATLKSKLTKKELRLFAMDSAQMSNEELKAGLELDDEELEIAKYKLYKKLKQDKVRLTFRESALGFDA
ncbi:MAG: hypothetical protein M0Q24_02175 [Sulfurimonas sp.]|uniref:hypothetical protein n=1 Tax=Sulfurimonas sp. TaxID=2022749 RepID=UPI0025E0BF5A|nr:hypothetical protein [Sulfurimonas sp.]MCK9490870.1 hypothetical protein [Sulfurimonas sp.]